MTAWVTGQGMTEGQVVTEVGSGLNGSAQSCGGSVGTWMRGWSAGSTATVWRALGLSTWKPLCRRRVARSWWLIPAKPPIICSAT